MRFRKRMIMPVIRLFLSIAGAFANRMPDDLAGLRLFKMSGDALLCHFRTMFISPCAELNSYLTCG